MYMYAYFGSSVTCGLLQWCYKSLAIVIIMRTTWHCISGNFFKGFNFCGGQWVLPLSLHMLAKVYTTETVTINICTLQKFSTTIIIHAKNFDGWIFVSRNMYFCHIDNVLTQVWLCGLQQGVVVNDTVRSILDNDFTIAGALMCIHMPFKVQVYSWFT